MDAREREKKIQAKAEASIHKISLYTQLYIGTARALTVEIFFLW
jgi:hypothetical protein